MNTQRWIAQGPYIKERDERGATIATVHTGNAEDAKLIAAAPQLLESLREMTDEWLRADRGTAIGLERCVKARAAIKDATS